MDSVLWWGVIAAVLLYVVKTLYRINTDSPKEEKKIFDTAADEGREEKSISRETEIPPAVTPEASFRQAEAYAIDDGYLTEKPSSDTTPPLVVKELIPETEHIDLDCFIYFKGAKLLVVEDNPLNQKIIASVLKQSGMLIDIAQNGQEALDYLFEEKREYDLVLMDISMPVMDGIAATKIIRKVSRFDTMPIVTFTAFSLGAEIEAMFEAGANAYLTKPLNVAQLYTVFTLFIGSVNRTLSLEKMLEIQGLDTQKGLEHAEEDETAYRQLLQAVVDRYSSSIELVPKWIEEKRYDRVRLECKEMLPALNLIGAYEMQKMVQEMQLQFIYRNEHLLGKFALLYRAQMQGLIDTIKMYLQADDHTQERKSDGKEVNGFSQS